MLKRSLHKSVAAADFNQAPAPPGRDSWTLGHMALVGPYTSEPKQGMPVLQALIASLRVLNNSCQTHSIVGHHPSDQLQEQDAPGLSPAVTKMGLLALSSERR